MEEYKVGALGDLISGTKSPGKGKKAGKQSPNKSITNGKMTPKGKQTPQKNKSPQKRPIGNISNKAKKTKLDIPNSEDDEDDESDIEDSEELSAEIDEESSDSEDELVSAEEDDEEASDDDNEETSDLEDQNEDDENESEDDDDAEEEEVNNSDDDEPEEQSSRPTQSESKYKERTIFVGNIKVGTQKKDIIKHFKKYGAVDSVRLRSIAVSNPKLGQKLAIQKGKLHPDRQTCNAYVRFAKLESAQEAVKHENGQEFNGFHIRVTMADIKSINHDNNKTLFVGNLSFKAEDEDLWKAFAPCGKIESVRIVRNKQTNVSLGFAYVNFASKDSVQLAMQMGDVTINGRVLRLKVSAFSSKKEKTVRPGNDKCVFITGFTAGTSKDEIKAAFASCGTVHKIRIIKDKRSGKPSGYGFVTFETSDEAKKALESKIVINKDEVEVLPPKRSLKSAKNDKASQKGPINQSKGKQQGGKVNLNKSLQYENKRKSGSPGKTFQGSQSNAGRVHKKKMHKGNLQKKKMIQKVAPKSPKK